MLGETEHSSGTNEVEHQSSESMLKVNGDSSEPTMTSNTITTTTTTATNSIKSKTDPSYVPARAYLDQTVVSILLDGMAEVVRQRPSNPIEYLASYLLENKEKYGE